MSKKRTIRFCVPLFLILLFAGTSGRAQDVSGNRTVYFTNGELLTAVPGNNPREKPEFSHRLLEATEDTWGYDILVNGKLLLHQPAMPGKENGKGFATREDAAKVALAVIGLLKNPARPPVLSTIELERMNVR